MGFWDKFKKRKKQKKIMLKNRKILKELKKLQWTL